MFVSRLSGSSGSRTMRLVSSVEPETWTMPCPKVPSQIRPGAISAMAKISIAVSCLPIRPVMAMKRAGA